MSGILEHFKVSCKSCGSEAVEIEDERGSSEESGAWGELYIKCVECGKSEEIEWA